MLEPYDGKLSRTVLRREGSREAPALSGDCIRGCNTCTGRGPGYNTLQIEREEFSMQIFHSRSMEKELKKALGTFPAAALLGPRQCGKSTLARHVAEGRDDVLFLDMESSHDLARLQEPEYYLSQHSEKLICIDEVQRRPDLFPVLRVLIDKERRPGRFLLLGSASPDLLRQSSESLAGRIAYLELTPFLRQESHSWCPLHRLWNRGGFPESTLAADDGQSTAWREQFIRTFLERDLPALGFGLPGPAMRRFWTMLAHYHGQTMNYSKLGQALDVSHATIRRWLEALEQTGMVRLLPPYAANVKKRLVKSPKVYLRDSGLLHSLLDVETWDELMGHPCVGSSWEGLVLEALAAALPRTQFFFYRTSSGEEIDFILQRKGIRIGVECKLSARPHLSRGLPGSMVACGVDRVFVVIPEAVDDGVRPGVRLCGLDEALDLLPKQFQ